MNVRLSTQHLALSTFYIWRKAQRYPFCWVSFIFLIAACTPLIPATTPPQLQHTPGAYVVIDERTLDAGIFQVTYPAGWHVVKNSIAAAPLSFVLVSPDDKMTIQMWVTDARCASPTPEPDKVLHFAVLEMQYQQHVCFIGTAPQDQEQAFRVIWEQVIASWEETS